MAFLPRIDCDLSDLNSFNGAAFYLRSDDLLNKRHIDCVHSSYMLSILIGIGDDGFYRLSLVNGVNTYVLTKLSAYLWRSGGVELLRLDGDCRIVKVGNVIRNDGGQLLDYGRPHVFCGVVSYSVDSTVSFDPMNVSPALFDHCFYSFYVDFGFV